ncbi:TetR/AcrR family transcriptional regulator [Streptomyces sp. NPDC050560]|uniref:TetR/AcrR family transcriptional regulator n=1 Tax=Streptomyces sp. NPDC050560 TaxID=3365630 RepID=UPI0037962671
MGSVTTAQRRASRPRADALRNRERIIDAASEMFIEYGPDVPMDEIARRAGIGNATLYRHFPDRTELMWEVVLYVADHVASLAEEANEAAEAEGGDAFDALRTFVHAAVEARIGALCPILTPGFDKDRAELAAQRHRFTDALERLMRRARDSGRLRPDVGVGDLMVALTQLARPLPGTNCVGIGRFVHRHLQLFLDGLMTPGRSELPGTAATLEDLKKEKCVPRTANR